MEFSTRAMLYLGVVAAAGLWTPAQLQAQSMEELAAEAAAGPPVVWYESSPEEQADAIVEAFNERFPDVEIEHIRITGGNQLAARAIQEVEARGYTADLLTGGSDHIWSLNDRGVLHKMDFTDIGIEDHLFPNDFTVATTASVYTIVYNTNRVSADELPTTWEEIVDEKWTDRVGSWVRAASFAQLSYAIGEERAEELLEEFVKLRPLLFQSTFPMAQQTAAGEVDWAIGFYHTSQPPIAAGAPIALAPLNPTPMHTIYSSISESAQNMAGAKLLLAWLSSPEGAIAYENATERGNPLLEGTRTQALIADVEISEWPPEMIAEYSEISERFNGILATVGEAR